MKPALVLTAMFDEEMNIRNVAEQANDTGLIQKATEIDVRAERRAGEMLWIAGKPGERAITSELPPATSRTLSTTTGRS